MKCRSSTLISDWFMCTNITYDISRTGAAKHHKYFDGIAKLHQLFDTVEQVIYYDMRCIL